MTTAFPHGPLQILVAGPLRGGTGDRPDLIQANLDRMEEAALALFERGHLPIVGEWLSLPLIERAGSTRIGDAVYDRIQHPLGALLVTKCDAVLRVAGASSGADLMVQTAHDHGIPVLHSVDETPIVAPS